MQHITISGNIGRDSELRTSQGGDDVLSFSVASKQGWGDKASTNWFRCSVWGKRARTLKEYLVKGTKVVAQGEFTIGEYDGKPQYDVRVNEVEFMSKASGEQSRGSQGGGGGGFQGGTDLDDDVPFITSAGMF